ncbi:MAG: membrane protein insertase YidC, partial [Pseudohongiellaceae bacterium]
MDHNRNALIVGLALVSYFMLLKWNEDYPQQAPPPNDAILEPVQNSLDLPQATNAETSTDLPQVQAEQGVIALQEADLNNLLISVTTPVHEV